MNRSEFQAIARARLVDAQVLLRAGRYTGAYYMAGYSIECALKACIARRTRRGDFPDRRSNNYYTHNLVKLVEHSGLQGSFTDARQADSKLNASWGVVKDWNEEARYQRKSKVEAQDLCAAVDDLLNWIRMLW